MSGLRGPSGSVAPPDVDNETDPPWTPVAAAVGAWCVCAVIVGGLAVSGPVSPGGAAILAGLALSVLFPGGLAALVGLVARRFGVTGPFRQLTLGAAVALALTPADPVAWGLAGAAIASLVVVPARAHRWVVAAGLGLYALTWASTPRLGGAEAGTSVLLVSIGGLSADQAQDWAVLQSMSRRGVSFRDATAPFGAEAASVRALATGSAPWETDAPLSMAEVTRERAWPSAAFVPHGVSVDGFDRVDSEDSWLVGARALPWARLLGTAGPRRADMTVDRALWWMQRQDGPFVAWVHLSDLGQPLDPPPPFDERYAAGSGDAVTACALDIPLPSTEREVARRYQGTLAMLAYEVQRLVDGAERLPGEIVVGVMGTNGAVVDDAGACGEVTGEASDWRVPVVVTGPMWPGGAVVEGPLEMHHAGPALLGADPSWLAAAEAGQTARSAALSATRLPTGWVASAANLHGRASVGAVDSWESWGSDVPEGALRSLLEAQARRVLMSLDTVDSGSQRR